MATKKKTRTPPPPRRVQAPKKRTGHRHETVEARRRLPLLLAGGGILAALAAGLVFVLAFGGGSGTSVPDAMRAAGCTYQEVQAKDNLRPGLRHVLKLPKGFKYNTSPPTSGLHYPRTILWGIYEAPVDKLRAVHNLEHGGIVVQYGNQVSGGAIRQLTEFYQSDPNGVVVAPLPALGNKISIAAWTFDVARLNERGYEGEGKLALCTRFDDGAFSKFRDDYRGHGPEPADVNQLTPGNP